ncbi:DUF4250 domain-containing protein, partial [Dysosmobacter welbionis]
TRFKFFTSCCQNPQQNFCCRNHVFKQDMFLAPVNFLHTYPDIDSSQTIFNQPCDVAAAERLFNDRC